MSERILAIGDIHGHALALDALLEAVNPRSDDQLVFLGDYVHRGPDTAGVLDRLTNLAGAADAAVFLRGNHDRMLLDAINDESQIPAWRRVAGDRPLTGYRPGEVEIPPREIPAEHRDFLEHRCRNWFETPDWIFVHAGISPDADPADESEERLLWVPLHTAEPHHSGRLVVCGHSSQSSGAIADLGHTVCIDTAIARGGRLTCLALPERRFWQASPDGRIRRGALR